MTLFLPLFMLALLQIGVATWPFAPKFTSEQANWTRVSDNCRYDANMTRTLLCYDPTSEEIRQNLEELTRILIVRDFADADVFDLCTLGNGTGLIEIRFEQHEITHLLLDGKCAAPFESRLRTFVLRDGRLPSGQNVTTALLRAWPTTIKHLDFSENQLNGQLFDPNSSLLRAELSSLNLSRNDFDQIPTVPETMTLRRVFLDRNQITTLNLSDLFVSQTGLEELTLDHNPIGKISEMPEHRKLQRLSLRYLSIHSVDLSDFEPLMGLTVLNLSHNTHLERIFGQLGSYQFDISHSHLFTFPADFFPKTTTSRYSVSIRGNPLLCHACQLRWLTDNLRTQVQCDLQQLNTSADCAVGTTLPAGTIVRQPYGQTAILRCQQYGDPPPSIRWYRMAPRTLLGGWKASSQTVSIGTDGQKQQIIPGGALLVPDLGLDDRERYLCVIANERGNATTVVRLRLDYAAWFWVKVYSGLFGIVTAIVFLFLNCIWNIIRRIIIWRVKRAEKTSRVKKMIEALEKYRQRQLEVLHERYNNKVNALRDSYQQQADTLRQRYANHSDWLRDYRGRQREAVASHWDTLRDNYQQQLTKMRDYGNRRADHLSESYERQITRIRTFTLQQRLRLMRQYEIKQRYLNKILESLNLENAASKLAANQNGNGADGEQVVQEMMTIRGWPPLDDDDDPLGLPPSSDRVEEEDEDEDTASVSTYHSAASFTSPPESRCGSPQIVTMCTTGTNTDARELREMMTRYRQTAV